MNLQTFQAARNSADAVDAAAMLLRDLIDYAGLFPPASLAMTSAVARRIEATAAGALDRSGRPGAAVTGTSMATTGSARSERKNQRKSG